jgi:hypothetical protein
MFVVDLRRGCRDPADPPDRRRRHFNEVFTDADPSRLAGGEYNNGWRQATAMLMYELPVIGNDGSGSISQPMYATLATRPRRGFA